MSEPDRGRALLAACTGAGCLSVLVVMLVLHAWPLWTGETVHLLVPRPVDPREPFRGDYVVLAYPFSSFAPRPPALSEIEDGPGTVPPAGEAGVAPRGEAASPGSPAGNGQPPVLEAKGGWRERATVAPGTGWMEIRGEYLGDRVCVQLERAEEAPPEAPDLYRAVSVSDRVEAGRRNLCGRVSGTSGSRELPGAGKVPVLRAEFGVEALYVPEGSGVAIERALGEEEPVYAEIALTPSGNGRLRRLIIRGEPVPPDGR